MDKEPIMIDDVDVSGCDFLAKEDDYSSYSGVTYAYKGQCGCSDEEMCKDRPNCFYKKALKQLKAKEQELNQLKVELKTEKNKLFLPTCYEQLYKEAIEMNSDIAKKYFELEKENKELKELVKTRIEDLCDSSSMFPMPCKVYEQALQEIKEIAERGFKHSQCNCGAKADLDIILQKCEVIKDE